MGGREGERGREGGREREREGGKARGRERGEKKGKHHTDTTHTPCTHSLFHSHTLISILVNVTEILNTHPKTSSGDCTCQYNGGCGQIALHRGWLNMVGGV